MESPNSRFLLLTLFVLFFFFPLSSGHDKREEATQSHTTESHGSYSYQASYNYKGCFSKVYAFGDSYTDKGNADLLGGSTSSTSGEQFSSSGSSSSDSKSSSSGSTSSNEKYTSNGSTSSSGSSSSNGSSSAEKSSSSGSTSSGGKSSSSGSGSSSSSKKSSSSGSTSSGGQSSSSGSSASSEKSSASGSTSPGGQSSSNEKSSASGSTSSGGQSSSSGSSSSGEKSSASGSTSSGGKFSSSGSTSSGGKSSSSGSSSSGGQSSSSGSSSSNEKSSSSGSTSSSAPSSSTGSASSSAQSSSNGTTTSQNNQNQFSDGRLVVDFLCDALGIPSLPAYKNSSADSKHGANFAVAGSTALPSEYLTKFAKVASSIWKGTPVNFQTQIDWFNNFQNQMGCKEKDGCKADMEDALFWIGGMGIDDYIRVLGSSVSLGWLKEKSVFHVCKLLKALLDSGAKYVVVQGLPPLGCLALDVSFCPVKNLDKMGCAIASNTATLIHNRVLQKKVEKFQAQYPNATIIYADYWKAFFTILANPSKYNIQEPFKACCGAGGNLNFNVRSLCGSPGTVKCSDPSKHVSWDGIHLTEAMQSHITDLLLNQGFCQPSFAELVKLKRGM